MNGVLTTGMMALVLTGVMVPMVTVEGDDGATALERLVMQMEDTVDQASRDVRLLPLEPVEAYGRTHGGAVESWTLLVRATSDIALADLVMLVQTEGLDVDSEAVRDSDGSLDHGIATQGDLIRLDVGLAKPVPGGASIEVLLEAPGARPASWVFTMPRNTAPDLVPIEVAARTR